MGKRCLKCGYERQPSDTAPDYECPNCGRVYAKVEAAYGYRKNTNEAKNSEDDRPTKACPYCGEEILAVAKKCKHCQTDLTVSREAAVNRSKSSSTRLSNRRQLVGLVGSAILFIGVFTPIVTLPIVGSMNYFHNGKGDGTIVLVLAVISLVLVFVKKYKGLWFTGIGSLGITLFTLVNLLARISKAKSDMEASLADNPFRGLADIAMQSVQLQWGWTLLIAGAALLVTSAAMRDAT